MPPEQMPASQEQQSAANRAQQQAEELIRQEEAMRAGSKPHAEQSNPLAGASEDEIDDVFGDLDKKN